MTRREFLASGLGWFPLFWRGPNKIRLAEAEFQVVRRGRSPNRYLHIHGNEETAREVLVRHMRIVPGTYFLIRSAVRNVPIRGGELDPNRMFSRAGAEANLKRLNPEWRPEQLARALDELDQGREKLLKELLPPLPGRLVALHNNSEAYSVRDEVPISDRLSIKSPERPRYFFLCTTPRDYEILSTSPYNVVLQQHVPKEDDGSLSRLAAKRGVRYINLEVAIGDAAAQHEMLDWLERHLP